MRDLEEVLGLLRIADLAKNWPNLKPIHDDAMRRLEQRDNPEVTAAKKRADDALTALQREASSHDKTRAALKTASSESSELKAKVVDLEETNATLRAQVSALQANAVADQPKEAPNGP